MSESNWKSYGGQFTGLYRDRENAWIFGVCAGVADRFNLQVAAVRLIAIVSLLVFFWLTVAVYIGATLLIKEKPLIYSGRRNESEFWRRCSRAHRSCR